MIKGVKAEPCWTQDEGCVLFRRVEHGPELFSYFSWVSPERRQGHKESPPSWEDSPREPNPRSPFEHPRPTVRELLPLPIFSTPASRSLRAPALKEQGLTPSYTVELGRLRQEAKGGPCKGLSPFRLWSPPQLPLQDGKDMPWKLTPLLLFLGWMISVCGARTRTDLLNVCMDAKHHKAEPGPEDKLHNQVRMECGSGLGGGLFRQGRGS